LQILTETGPFKPLLLQSRFFFVVVLHETMLRREMPGKGLVFGMVFFPQLFYQIRQNIFTQQQSGLGDFKPNAAI